MIVKHKKSVKLDVTKDILCNKCGKSCKAAQEHFECAELHAHWGYFSDKRDGQVHDAHLCQSCWEALTRTFKIPSLIEERF